MTVVPIQKECHLYLVNQVTRFALISFVSKMIHAALLFYQHLHVTFTHLNDHSLFNNYKFETVLQATALTAHAAKLLFAIAQPQQWLVEELEAMLVPIMKKDKRASYLHAALLCQVTEELEPDLLPQVLPGHSTTSGAGS